MISVSNLFHSLSEYLSLDSFVSSESSICSSSIHFGIGAACLLSIGYGVYCVAKAALADPLSIPLDRFEKHRKSNFLKRVSIEEWDGVLEKIQNLKSRASLKEIQAYKAGDWDHSAFQKEDWIYTAFHAYLEDRLDKDQMCKLFLYWECCEQAKKDGAPLAPPSFCHDRLSCFQKKEQRLKSYQLYSQGKIDRHALAVLKKATKSYLDEDQISLVLKAFQDLPEEAGQFFCIQREPDLLFDLLTASAQRGLFLFSYFTGNKKVQLVAPPQFTQIIHQVKYPKSAILAEPVLGYSTKEKLSDFKKRVIFIPSIFSAPTHIHEAPTVPLSITYHDGAYHHAIESANPHRKLWVELALFFKENQLAQVVPHTLDRDLFDYHYLEDLKDSEKFWIALAAHVFSLERSNLLTKDAFCSYFAQFYETKKHLFDSYELRPHDLNALMLEEKRLGKETTVFFSELQKILSASFWNRYSD